MSIIKRKAGSEDIVKSVLEFDAVPTEGSHNLVESGAVAQAIGDDIKTYADDFIDITDEFTLINGANVYLNNVVVTKDDLHILFSKKLELIYFDCNTEIRLIASSYLVNTWSVMLRYDGNRFRTNYNTSGTSNNPYPITFVKPTNINRGALLFNLVIPTSTTQNFGRIGYVGNYPSTDNGIGVVKDIGTTECSGFAPAQVCFHVDPN